MAHLKKIKLRLSILLVTIFLSFPLVCLILFSYITTPQTYILGQDFSLLSKNELSAKINSSFNLPSSIDFVLDDKSISTLDIASISAQIKVDSLVQKIFYTDVKSKLLFLKPRHYQLDITYDQDQLDSFITSLKDKVEHPFVPSQINISPKGDLTITDGSLGQSLDSQKLTFDLLFNLKTLDSSSISLVLTSIGQLPDSTQIDNILARAKVLKDKSITLDIPDTDSYLISDLTLMSWLDFYQSFDSQKITAFVDDLSQSLKTDPIDAVFQFENNKVSQFRASSKGRVVDKPQLISILTSSLENILSTQVNPDPKDIPFVYIDPLVRNEDVNNLGIKELIGSGLSSFKHSSIIRNKNIKKGAEVINFILVPPGDVISFNKHLGDVSIESGYLMAYIIRQGKTELDVGGGICQVSTTLFRAAINTGLPIVERRPHAYRVSYYEEGSKPGFDATIFLPSPDLKFKNDTGSHILIQSFYNDEVRSLTYNIYGTNDGRVVKIDNYRQWDYSQPPPDRYIDDPSLPIGKVIQDEQRIPGLKTAFDWTVERSGQILHQQTFTSSYVPWAAVFRRGPNP